MDILVVTYFLNGFLMIAMPIGLAIYFSHKANLGWRLFGIGALTFIFSQVGHIPFNWAVGKLLNQSGLFYWNQVAQTIFSAVFLGLSAGIFEEMARYLVLRYWAKDARSWQTALMFGAGHGGIEAIILGVLVLLGFFSMLAFRDADLSQVVPAAQLELAQKQVSAYWSAPWFATTLGALERFFTIPCHICMAVMVMQVFTRKNILWLFTAIGYHALLDGAAVLGSHYLGVYWTEAFIGVFAVISVILIFVLRQPEPQLEPEPMQAPVLLDIPVLKPVEESEENLENTRYQ